MCGHKTEKVVLPGQCGGSKKSLFFLRSFIRSLLVDEFEVLCIQPAATNLDSTTSSRTSFSCRRSQELDEHKCETVLLHVLYQPAWSQNQNTQDVVANTSSNW